MICITFVPNYKRTSFRSHIDVSFLELPKMQCACVMLAEKFSGHLNLLCTFPGGHLSERVFIIIVKWFAFLNKRPQRERDGHCGNEVGTLRRDRNIASHIASYIYRHPATIALLWLERPRPYRPTMMKS